VKHHIKLSRGPIEPGGLAVELAIELEYDERLATVEHAEDLQERLTVAVSSAVSAINRQFPAAKTKHEPAELAPDDGDDAYRTAAPPRGDDQAPFGPFNEFDGQPSAPPAPPPIPPRPGGHVNRLPPSPNGGKEGKPPKSARELLGWLKDRDEAKKRAVAIGKAWDYGWQISSWDADQVAAVYRQLLTEHHSGWGQRNGVH
jgi:hypothetical protein